ncbi:MAG TPA: Asp-tRNA(Asn)/Glu-tRNA(Gln) amidotransferase subunit GatB [Abditibacteriaceae bacterium]|nr:Asp-tRNA(Asn)/Glu-tRNA(Gln) amidotransferase subunit GatB [Abditibacteriaceae bacterium]
MPKYEIVIGMEVHAELLTVTKQFCGCANVALAPPNTSVCPVCMGFPGSLPVLNEKSVDLSLRTVLAFGSKINTRCIFERKNYYYPDLPKAYQISQRLLPLGEGGHVDIDVAGDNGTSTKRIGLHDVHMEEDTGKSQHGDAIGDPDSSLVDFNRSGIPLLEIVSLPDMRSIEEAESYMSTLRQILLYLEVSDCKMEQGRLRFEASVSLRPWGQIEYGTRVEVKNLNSMKAVRDSLRAEIARQEKILDGGGVVHQQTMLWDEASGTTQPMRSKEHAHDYRYFPEPDLVPLDIDEAWLERVRAGMPELPRARRQRFQEQLGLSAYEAAVLTSTREIAAYFEAAAEGYDAPKTISNWIANELLGRLNAENKSINEVAVRPEQLRDLVKLIDGGTISGKIAKEVFDDMFETGRHPALIVQERGLQQISDSGELEEICRRVIAANGRAVEDYLAGKEKSFGALVGGVMKETKGRANPALVNELLKKQLGR